MSTLINPTDLPHVAGHLMVAPVGTRWPGVDVRYGEFSRDWGRSWTMANDHQFWVQVDRGCRCRADQWVWVFREVAPPALAVVDSERFVHAAVDATGDGIRLTAEYAAPCPTAPRSPLRAVWHVGTPDDPDDVPWRLWVAGYSPRPHPLTVTPVVDSALVPRVEASRG